MGIGFCILGCGLLPIAEAGKQYTISEIMFSKIGTLDYGRTLGIFYVGMGAVLLTPTCAVVVLGRERAYRAVARRFEEATPKPRNPLQVDVIVRRRKAVNAPRSGF